MADTRTCWFEMILYPDNCYHMEILKWLDDDRSITQAAYILHEPEEDEKKQHYHVLLHYPTKRTLKGVVKSFGSGDFRRIGDKYEPCPDTTGIEPNEIEVKPLLVEDVTCFRVSDKISRVMYFMHKDFNCIRAGKKEYSFSDIKVCKHDYAFLSSLLEKEEMQCSGNELTTILDTIESYNLDRLSDVIKHFALNEPRLLNYVEKHSYLITQILKERI